METVHGVLPRGRVPSFPIIESDHTQTDHFPHNSQYESDTHPQKDLKPWLREIIHNTYGISHESLFPEPEGFAERL